MGAHVLQQDQLPPFPWGWRLLAAGLLATLARAGAALPAACPPAG